jgi:NifU-like protein
MTLDEAAKVTNQDIVDVLGELPEEKLHCSVMGMEALQAAIANYRGEIVTQDDTEHEGRVVCKCFGITDTKIRKIIKDNNIRTTTGVTNYCKAGGACGTCLDDIHEIIEGVWKNQSESVAPENAQSAFSALSLVQKVIKIQEVIDKEIKPLLESDGGSIELADIRDNVIQVRLKGRCAVCPTSQVTLKHTVEGKLREFVSPELRVENI